MEFPRKLLLLLALMFTSVILSSCSTTKPYTPLLSAEPAIGGEFSRAPRTLRLFFDALPDVSQSSLSLSGPAGDYSLRGMHSMAADDLMVEILDPLEVGDYLLEWTTVVGNDPAIYTGSFNFSVIEGQ